MQPKTKLQKEVVGLSAQLHDLVGGEILWAKDTLFKNYACRMKTQIYCLSCGFQWKNTESDLAIVMLGCTCPECNTELQIVNHNGDFTKTEYFSVLQTKDDFQVQRVFVIHKHMKKRTEARYFTEEVIQHWIRSSDGKRTGLYKLQQMPYYSDYWKGELEVRQESNYGGFTGRGYSSYYLKDKNEITGVVYPKKKILPIIKRNGFKSSFYGIHPHKLFSALLSDNFAETLIKTKKIELLKKIISINYKEKAYFPAIKTCLRNKYIIKDFSNWSDLVMLQLHFGRDITNPKYVCPKDLNKEHDRLVEKKRMQQRKKKIADLKKQLDAWEKHYKQAKSKYFKLKFEKGDLTVTVLKSVKEFLYENEAHGHCIFENEYFNKFNSLCFRAEYKGVQVETTEVHLNKMQINQSRGKGNKASVHNKAILKLVNDNMHLIKKAYLQKPKKNVRKKKEVVYQVAV